MLVKHAFSVPGLLALLVASVAASLSACSSDGSSADLDAAGAAGSANSSGGNGSAGVSHAQGGGAGSSGPSGEAGTLGEAGSLSLAEAGALGEAGSFGEGGAPSTSTADALPESTFLYVYSETANRDLLVARDLKTGQERLVTDLRGDGSEGWEIWGHSISPDRRRIAIASLFAPTKADVDTKLSTRNVFTLASDGSDFQRLTPVSPNTGGARTNFSISVQDPVFSADGSAVIYDFGNWWYEGTKLQGGSRPWFVSTAGSLPQPFPTISSCTVIDPSINPATGDVLLIHSVCVNSDDEGIFLYPSTGGSAPTKLVDKGYGPGAVDPSLEKASWLADGSGFVFVGNLELTRGTETITAASLLAFDMTSGDISVLLIPEPNTRIRNASVAPDGSAIVYCLSHDDGYDLHVIDLTSEPAEDAPITDDGKSCSPGF